MINAMKNDATLNMLKDAYAKRERQRLNRLKNGGDVEYIHFMELQLDELAKTCARLNDYNVVDAVDYVRGFED